METINAFFNNILLAMPKCTVGDTFELWLNGVIKSNNAGLSAVRDVLLTIMLSIEKCIFMVPWWAAVIIVLWAGWKLCGMKSGIALAFLISLVAWIGQWELMCYSLTIVYTTLLLSAIIGIPVGIIMACSDSVDHALHPVLDAMQVIPLFVYFLPVIMLFGVGRVPSLLASLIFSLPPIIRLTNMGIRQVPASTVTAADAFGCTPLQKLVKVQIPQAAEAIAMGLNQTTIVALGMSVSASVIGCKGLGLELYGALSYLDIGRALEVGIVIFAVAVTLDRITQGIARKLMR